MSGYKPYPKYKDSGYNHLGSIPENWNIVPFKRLALIRNGKDFKDVEIDIGGYPVIGSGGEFARSSEFLYNGESVLLGRKGTIDKPIYMNGAFWTVDTMFYSELSKDACGKYLFYLCLTIPFTQLSTSTTVPSMTQEALGSIVFSVPTYNEQKVIASFLDRETLRIDTLIQEQRELIVLLKEKRQAVISNAVTKGLNPKVKMKDSGVEWIGEIPAHWDVKKVKHVFANLDFRRVPIEASVRGIRSGEYPYYGASGIIDLIDDYIFDEPLILIGEDGANLLSRSTPLAFIASGKYWVNNHAHILRPKNGFLVFWSSVLNLVDLTPIATGSAQPKLTADALGNICLPLPPENEQAEIESHLENSLGNLDLLISEAESAIELMLEHRASLISEAVTGKIDVRGVNV